MFGIARMRQKPPAAAARDAGLEVLLVLAPGRAQVNVGVDEAGQHDLALAVDHLAALGRLQRARRAQLGDHALVHEQVV